MEQHDIESLFQELNSAKEALNQVRYQNEMMLRWVEGAVLLVDRQGVIIQANDVALQALGWKEEELIGQKCHETIHHTLEDGGEYPWEFCPVFAALEDGSSHHVSGDIFWNKEGTSFSVDYIACSTRNEQNEVNGAVLTFRNLTEMRLQEANRIHGMKLESIGELSAGIAHEINTPMQFVGGNLAFLQEGFDDLLTLFNRYKTFRQSVAQEEKFTAACEELLEFEEEIDVDYLKEEVPTAFSQTQEGVDRVIKLVQGLKGFAHSDSNHAKQAMDINTIIENTLVVSRNEYKYVADIETHFNTIPMIMVYPGDIGQVILNLIVNAAHAIGDATAESEEKGCIRIETCQQGNEIVITITDTGTGIPDSVKNRIFDPFFTTKEVGKGSGQGLAIARTIIHDKHQGTLACTSTSSKGTTFSIRLPAESSDK
ncbi:MAG: PAS domain-containing protein [Proteobacteria bacterium]|nr:PAS domain-containing protein [Pseudomonadota bacterium]MBU1057673.1 PAS domain-containing protein [Pseudomonadota bacterium]